MTREEIQKRAHEAHHKWRYSTVDFRDAVDVMTDFALSINEELLAEIERLNNVLESRKSIGG